MRMCPLCLVAAVGIIGAGAFMLVGGAGEKPAAPAPLAAEAFEIDPVHSSIVFKIKHQGVSYFYGRFNKASGSFDIDAAKPEATTIDASVDVNSVDTNDPKRDTHVKSQSFFSAKEFPAITFKSKSAVKGTGDKIAVTGDLTLHGVTKSITVDVLPTGSGKGMQGGTVAGLEATFTIKRSDYGMTQMVGPIGDDVTLIVSFEGAKK